MTISLKHAFQSAKGDPPDTTLVRPSNWNAEHTMTMATAKVLGRTTSGTGAVEEIDWTAYGRQVLNAADSAALIALLANGGLSYAKIQDVSATNKLLGRYSSGSGDIQEIGIGTGITLTGGTLNFTSALPRGYISGCILANSSGDSTNDITVSAGACRDSTNTADITIAASTKQLDANWVAGTSGGMRYSGAGITNTTYHIYAVGTAAGVSGVYADPSTTISTVLGHLQAETGGASYVYARRIGSIIRESSAIVGFVQDGDYFGRKVPGSDTAVNNPGTSAISLTLKVPTGIRVLADFYYYAQNLGGTATSYVVSDLSTTDTAPTTMSATPGVTCFGSMYSNAQLISRQSVWTNTSGQIRSRQSTSSTNFTTWAYTIGWTDLRGKE